MNILKIHSTVGLITNSSSVVYTNQNSIDETKKLINVFFKTFDIENKTADDIFYFGLYHAPFHYTDREYIETEIEFRNIVSQVLRGEIIKPDWLKIQKEPNSDILLYMIPKNSEYQELADAVSELLSSVKSEEGYG